MSDDVVWSSSTETEQAKPQRKPPGGGASPVYALGLVGALVYYWRRAEGGPEHARAVGKAVVWPAFVVHDLLRHLEG